MKRTRIRPQSQKRARVNRIRRDVVQRLLAERGPYCQARLPCCDTRAVDPHEIVPRGRGGSIVDGRNILLVCRTCHIYITEHDVEACELGLSARSWQAVEGEGGLIPPPDWGG